MHTWRVCLNTCERFKMTEVGRKQFHSPILILSNNGYQWKASRQHVKKRKSEGKWLILYWLHIWNLFTPDINSVNNKVLWGKVSRSHARMVWKTLLFKSRQAQRKPDHLVNGLLRLQTENPPPRTWKLHPQRNMWSVEAWWLSKPVQNNPKLHLPSPSQQTASPIFLPINSHYPLIVWREACPSLALLASMLADYIVKLSVFANGIGSYMPRIAIPCSISPPKSVK